MLKAVVVTSEKCDSPRLGKTFLMNTKKLSWKEDFHFIMLTHIVLLYKWMFLGLRDTKRDIAWMLLFVLYLNLTNTHFPYIPNVESLKKRILYNQTIPRKLPTMLDLVELTWECFVGYKMKPFFTTERLLQHELSASFKNRASIKLFCVI